jgi:hypothetical protein
MKKSELRQIIREEISKAIDKDNQDFIYRKDSGAGRATMVLKLKPNAWEKVKHLFDEAGRPKSNEIKRIPGRPKSNEIKRIPFGGQVWDLYSKSMGNLHKIYGVSGDWTFGNAPLFYQQRHRGNIKAAKHIFDMFIEKYL